MAGGPRSVAQVQKELSTLAVKIIDPLKKGLSAFNTVLLMLLSANTDVINAKSQIFGNVRTEILKMKESFTKSEEMVSAELRLVDADTQGLTAEKRRLDWEKQSINSGQLTLRHQVQSAESLAASYRAVLSKEQTQLRRAKEHLENVKKEKEEIQKQRTTAYYLLIIPVAGWIAGPILLKDANDREAEAAEKLKKAEGNVRYYESEINRVTENLSLKYKAIKFYNDKLSRIDRYFEEVEPTLQALAEQRRVFASFQSKTRQVVKQMGSLSAMANVAEVETRSLIVMESILEVIDEMLGHIKGNNQNFTEEMRKLVSDMKNNHTKLKAVQASKKGDGELDTYM